MMSSMLPRGASHAMRPTSSMHSTFSPTIFTSQAPVPSCSMRYEQARRPVSCAASPRTTEAEVVTTSEASTSETTRRDPHKNSEKSSGMGLGDLLGPIGLTYSGGIEPKVHAERVQSQSGSETSSQDIITARSIHSMTTEEWRQKYEKDGTVDLWVEEEFNAGSRLVGGRAVHKGGMYGILTGEGPSLSNATRHRVQIHNHYSDQLVDVEVPEDRYILWEAEDAGLELPYACRMGCCTACAVRIKEGEMYQPEALGISAELREQGYGLMCVGYPLTDLVLETVPEDEVYELQFGHVFASKALDPTNPESIERDDFALEIANMDE